MAKQLVEFASRSGDKGTGLAQLLERPEFHANIRDIHILLENRERIFGERLPGEVGRSRCLGPNERKKHILISGARDEIDSQYAIKSIE